MSFQITRVISSPSSSTSGVVICIFSIGASSDVCKIKGIIPAPPGKGKRDERRTLVPQLVKNLPQGMPRR